MKNLKTKKKKNSVFILSALLSGLITNQISGQIVVVERQSSSRRMDSDLRYISCIESSCGKNKKHRTVRTGINRGHRAAGSFGIMPITAKEIIKKDKSLMSKYGYMVELSHEEITRIINLNKTLDIDLANSHWARLSKVFPKSEIKRVYAWNNGITGTIASSQEQIHNHPYVIKFKKLKYMDTIFEFNKVGARD